MASEKRQRTELVAVRIRLRKKYRKWHEEGRLVVNADNQIQLVEDTP